MDAAPWIAIAAGAAAVIGTVLRAGRVWARLDDLAAAMHRLEHQAERTSRRLQDVRAELGITSGVEAHDRRLDR